jgi:hypothetical protein
MQDGIVPIENNNEGTYIFFSAQDLFYLFILFIYF